MIAYLATVHKDPDSDYGVQFYDFPGCITAGETIEEAKLMALVPTAVGQTIQT